MNIVFTPSSRTIDLPEEVEGLSQAYRSGMMDAGELLHLAATIALYPWGQQASVVEIGAYTGRTTVFMAKVLQLLGHSVPILSVDPFERAIPDPINPQGVYAEYLKIVKNENLDHLCLPLVAFSEDAAPIVPANIGVLVVDGSHHYPVVSKDFALYAPKVLAGGLIFIDDYVAAYPGVMRAVDEYFTRERPWRVLHQTYFVVAQRTK